MKRKSDDIYRTTIFEHHFFSAFIVDFRVLRSIAEPSKTPSLLQPRCSCLWDGASAIGEGNHGHGIRSRHEHSGECNLPEKGEESACPWHPSFGSLNKLTEWKLQEVVEQPLTLNAKVSYIRHTDVYSTSILYTYDKYIWYIYIYIVYIYIYCIYIYILYIYIYILYIYIVYIYIYIVYIYIYIHIVYCICVYIYLYMYIYIYIYILYVYIYIYIYIYVYIYIYISVCAWTSNDAYACMP